MGIEVETLGKGGSTHRMSRYDPLASCESSLIYAIDFVSKLETHTYVSIFKYPKMCKQGDHKTQID